MMEIYRIARESDTYSIFVNKWNNHKIKSLDKLTTEFLMYTDFDIMDIRVKDRHRYLNDARMLLGFYLSKLKFPLKVVANHMLRHHSSIVYYTHAVDSLLRYDVNFCKRYDGIISTFKLRDYL